MAWTTQLSSSSSSVLDSSEPVIRYNLCAAPNSSNSSSIFLHIFPSSNLGLGEELDRKRAELRGKLLAAKEDLANALARQARLESQLELLDRREKAMFQRELSSINELERLESESAIAGGMSEYKKANIGTRMSVANICI